MPNTFTEQTFRSTYKDDHRDSDGYHRVLFNAGRALQARELTQMQTIIQQEIKRFADNIFQKDGVPVKAGGISVNDKYGYIKIANDPNNAFSDVDSLKGVRLTGGGITVRVYEAVAAEGSDPNTLYVQYEDDTVVIAPVSTSRSSARLVSPGTVLTNGSDINLTVQTTDTAANPAVGFGSSVEVGDAHFYAQGHFVFVPKQRIFLSKYNNRITSDVGFKVVQDVVTVSDTDALYDNQNVTPNRSSPGADRYRIRLVLSRRDQVELGDTFIYFARIEGGILVDSLTSQSGYNEVKDFVATRIKEINGDFIKKYWKLRFQPNGTNATNSLIMKIDPGLAYIDGRRVETTVTRTLRIPKATDTVEFPESQIGIDYGNFYYFNRGVGMLDIDTCEKVNLYAGFGGQDSVIGTAHVRAITEGQQSTRVRGIGQSDFTYDSAPLYKVHLFDIIRNNFNYSLRDVKSIKSQSDSDYVNLCQVANNVGAILHEPRKNALLFDTPISRPKGFTDITMTFMKKYTFTAVGSTHTLTLTDSGETFVNQSDILIASEDEFAPSGVSPAIQSGNKQIVFSTLDAGKRYEVITFVKKTNAEIKTKTLTETTVSSTLDSDGFGVKYVNLGKSDIYSIDRLRLSDSDGDDIFSSFLFDPGHRVGFMGDGRLMWTGGGLTDSATDTIFVRFKYFDPSASGQLYAVNSYDGQVDYLKVPAQKLPDGRKVSLRDVLDLRPSTDGSGNFTTIPPLPVPKDTIITDAEYYLPRSDKLVASRNGELRYITGSSSLNPKYPDTPDDCIDLYKIRMNPNTMHSQDLKATLIPRKGYTMQDINKLEEKVDRLQEMTTLSLLELNTKFLRVLDSDGNERTKSGFFVDNFANHKFSQTTADDYRAAIDKRGKLLRPSFVEDCVNLVFDSANTEYVQSNTVVRDDLVMLDYYEVAKEAQDIATGTENLAPFFVQTTLGDMKLSPEIDNWFETEIVGERVVGQTTEFDLRHAVNWNHSENQWFGIDPSDLEVGDTAGFVSGTSTSLTHNSIDTTLVGTETTEKMGEWVETGSITDIETLSTETVEISRERVEELKRTDIDVQTWTIDNYTQFGTQGYAGAYGIGFVFNGGYSAVSVELETSVYDLWDVVTSETRESVRTTNTSTYEATKTIETENTYEGLAEVITTTTTSNTVNRIAGENIIRDVIGDRFVELSAIPWMRSVKIFFQADGLRPNTQYFPFFDDANVSTFCREETEFRTLNQQQTDNIANNLDDNTTVQTTQSHSQGSTNLVTDDEGTVIGSFEVPNNASMRFPTGTREFMLLDVNSKNLTQAQSYAVATFSSKGDVEKVEDEVQIIRQLQVVGSTSDRVTDRSVDLQRTSWTRTIIDTEIATDVQSTETITDIVTDTTTTREYLGEDVRVRVISDRGIEPIDPTIPNPVPGASQEVDEETGRSRVDLEHDEDLWHNAPYGGGGVDASMTGYQDPLAQTFLVKSPRFITSLEFYFASKSSDRPVICEIRPTVNGVPHAFKKIASKKLSPSQVTLVPEGSTNSDMLRYSTKFTFDAPVYLDKGEYAMVLRPGNNSPDYNVYAASVGEYHIGSNEARCGQQSTLGAFFKSQNGKLWEPVSGTDLSYRINVAMFEQSGNAYLENVNVPPVALARDPLYIPYENSNIVRVMHRGHGLRDGDKTIIRGVDSDETFDNGLTGADINGVRTVVSYDNSGYTYQASSNATKRTWFGGSSVTSQRNVNFEVLRPQIHIKTPRATNATMSIKTTSQKSLAGSQTPYVKDAKFQIIENKKNNAFTTPRAIFSRSNENLTGAGKLEGARSATVQITLKTVDPFVSPVIDLQQAKLNCVHNLISRQDSAATDGFNVPLTYINEENANRGTESAKHITKAVTLAEEAVGLRVLLAANKPPAADFQVWYRVAPEGNPLFKRGWQLVNPENVLPSDLNKNVFREYRYLIGGDGGTTEPFTQFQLKIVMRSTNSAQVPSFRDLRAIALAV